MSLYDSIGRLERLHHYISIRKTGTRQELAERLDISISTLNDYLSFMKLKLDAPIDYDFDNRTYFYRSEGDFIFSFQNKNQQILMETFIKNTYEYLVENKLVNPVGEGDRFTGEGG